jgi:hypothetical protein
MMEDNGVRPELRAVSRPASAAPSGTAEARSVRVLGDLVHTTTRDLLNYFAKCPHCGYAVQASETTRAFSRGLVERRVFRTCGLPCGWHDSSQEITDAVPSIS